MPHKNLSWLHMGGFCFPYSIANKAEVLLHNVIAMAQPLTVQSHKPSHDEVHIKSPQQSCAQIPWGISASAQVLMFPLLLHFCLPYSRFYPLLSPNLTQIAFSNKYDWSQASVCLLGPLLSSRRISKPWVPSPLWCLITSKAQTDILAMTFP